MALLTGPRVLLLDEPCAGLSPEETAAVIGIVRWAAQRLAAIIVIDKPRNGDRVGKTRGCCPASAKADE
jgi:ABC-type branched-subunit amino acid transport system ATPase component